MNINNIISISVSPEAAAIDSMPPPSVKNNSHRADKVRDIESSKRAPDKKESVSSKEPVSSKDVREMVEVVNEYMTGFQTNLGFYIREDLNHQIVVEIKDSKTDELIKQIPTEEMLLIKEKMEELTGLIFDQTV